MQFMSPEILNEEAYDSKTDSFSFGSVLYCIITGSTPKVKLIDLLKGKRAPIPSEVAPLARDLITKCWSHDPSSHPSFEEIHEALTRENFMLFNDVDSNTVWEKHDQLI